MWACVAAAARGFQYALALDEKRDDDHVFESAGVRAVDPASLRYVGAHGGLHRELLASGFEVSNPNVVASCGLRLRRSAWPTKSRPAALLSDVADLTAALVAIDSVNPTLEPGGAGEAEVAACVAGWAQEAGLEVELLEETPGRPSVLVRARGSGGGRTLLLCGHLDTVGVEGMSAPHEPRVERATGSTARGAYDMKAGVAAALVACREAAGLGLAGDVVVAAVADEEHSSVGVQEALRALEADAAIVTEPTQLQPSERPSRLRVARDRRSGGGRSTARATTSAWTRSSRPGRC